MELSSSCCWLWWLANTAVCWVGTAVVVRRLLVPWTCWLGRRALCWCRYALFYGPSGIGPEGRRAPPACQCCGGVHFDGMAGSWAGKCARDDRLKIFRWNLKSQLAHIFLSELKIDICIILVSETNFLQKRNDTFPSTVPLYPRKKIVSYRLLGTFHFFPNICFHVFFL